MSGAGGDPPPKRLKGNNGEGETSAKVEESPTKQELMRVQLAERDAQLAERDAQLARFIQHAKRRSLQTLLTLKESSQFSLKRIGSESSHVKGARETAFANEKPFAMINLEIAEGDTIFFDSVSKTLLRIVDQDHGPPLKFIPIHYASEADIASIVNDVLHDAIAILKYQGVSITGLGVYQERSLFSGRPDILVVRSSAHQLPLLVVEVKKPIVDGDGRLCDKGKALGQAYDYAESLRACGHPEPVVVLTTVEETCVCWNSEVATTGPETPQNRKESSTSTSGTPPMLQSPGSAQSVSRNEHDCVFDPASSRDFNRSKVFEAHQLVHVLCTTLRRAVSSTHAKEKSIYKLELGRTYHFPSVLRFTGVGDRYTWGSLTVRVGSVISSRRHNSSSSTRRKKNYETIDDADDSAYYLIGKLGHGATSNVWHALNSEGNEVVIKMYVKTTDKSGSVLDSKGFEDAAKCATEAEVDKLTRFYSVLKGKVFHKELGGFHCVVMPFFSPVPKQSRDNTLVKVQEVLERVFVPMKLKYEDEDVRWSHVGTYVVTDNTEDSGKTQTHHILYDLADLVQVDDESESPWVENHLQILKVRIGNEPEPVREQFAHKEVSTSE